MGLRNYLPPSRVKYDEDKLRPRWHLLSSVLTFGRVFPCSYHQVAVDVPSPDLLTLRSVHHRALPKGDVAVQPVAQADGIRRVHGLADFGQAVGPRAS